MTGFIHPAIVYNIDGCELTSCQLKEGVLSEWQIIYQETFKVDVTVKAY